MDRHHLKLQCRATPLRDHKIAVAEELKRRKTLILVFFLFIKIPMQRIIGIEEKIAQTQRLILPTERTPFAFG